MASIANDLDLMVASQHMGEIIARTICAEMPGLNARELTQVAASEVFMAAQDMHRSAVVESQQQAARLRSERAA